MRFRDDLRPLRRHTLPLFFAAALPLLLAGAPPTSQKAEKAPAAAQTGPSQGSRTAALPRGVFLRINGQDVTRERFLAEIDQVLGDSYRQTFIDHVLIDQRARESGIEATAAEIEASAQKTVDQILRDRFAGDSRKMDEALAERRMTLEGWKARLRVDGRYDLLLDRLVRKDRTVADEALRRLFEDRYGKDGIRQKVRHIQKNVLVAASQDYTLQQYDQEKGKIEDEARARAEEALAKIKAGRPFESVMAEYSDDPRKATGGLLGSAWKGRFGPELDAAAAGLAKDAVSGVLKCPDGYRIVQVTQVAQNEELHALHILVATGARGKGRTDEEAKKLADGLLAKIRGGADFGELARTSSDDPGSAQRGGDLGFFGRRAMVQPFEDAAFALQPGQVGEVVKSPFGYHIIKLLERRSVEEKTLRQVLVSTQFAMVKDRRLRPALEAKARAELEAVAQRIAKGESFAEIAKQTSDDLPSKNDGGLLARYREGVYGGGFDEAVRTLQPGEKPRIVSDAAGNLHLVLFEGTVKTDFASVKDALFKEEMDRPVSEQEKADYVKKLRDRASIEP